MNDSAHTPVQTDQNVTAYMYSHARLLDKYKTLVILCLMIASKSCPITQRPLESKCSH